MLLLPLLFIFNVFEFSEYSFGDDDEWLDKFGQCKNGTHFNNDKFWLLSIVYQLAGFRLTGLMKNIKDVPKWEQFGEYLELFQKCYKTLKW